MNNFVIVLGLIVVIAAALFWREVLGIFAGMSPLEAMKQIVTFILHVAVATIAAYAVMTVPEFIKPWIRTFRSRQRQARRGRGATAVQSVKTPGLSKLSKDKMLIALTQQLMQKQAKGGERPAAVQDGQEKIHFDF
jgi:cytochrome c oxidase assembly factor CtaG